MNFKNMLKVFSIPLLLFASDPDQHPELISQTAMDEFDQEGDVCFRISMTDEIAYKLKTRIDYRHAQFNYLCEGKDLDLAHTASIALSCKYVDIGLGRGSPHIGRGIILGSTMMRYTSDPNTNVGYCRSNIGLKNYSYNRKLAYIKGNYRGIKAGIFRFNEKYLFIGEYESKTRSTACSIYFLDRPLMEIYSAYHDDFNRACINISLYEKRLNHLLLDYLYKNKNLKLFISLVQCDKNYIGFAPDSKWGSSLMANSKGIAAGYYYRFGKIKMCTSWVRIRGNEKKEDKVIADINYKHKQVGLCLSANYRVRSTLKENSLVPALLDWDKSAQSLLKFKLNYRVSQSLSLLSQIQLNILDLNAFTSIMRLMYKNNSSKIVFQVSQVRSSLSDLYYLRPLSTSSYSIRKAGKSGVFIDIVFEKSFKDVKIGILVRNEGVNINLTI